MLEEDSGSDVREPGAGDVAATTVEDSELNKDPGAGGTSRLSDDEGSTPSSSGDEDKDAVEPFLLTDDEVSSSSSADGDDFEPGARAPDLPREPHAVELIRPTLPTMPFKCVEHLYAYLLLRGQCHGTEELYDVARAGFNIASPVSLPSSNTVRYNMSPVVDAEWLLPTMSFSTRERSTGKVVSVRYVAPSAHIRRDLAFDATFNLFKKADARGSVDRGLHPEFVDSPLFQDRASVLMSGRLVPNFVLGGIRLSAGDKTDARLLGGRLLQNLHIKRAFFASARTGLARSRAAHAGDFIVECDVGTDASGGAGYFVSRHWCATSLCPLTWHSDGSSGVEVLELRRVGVSEAAGLAAMGTSSGQGSSQPSNSTSSRRMMWGEENGEKFLVVSLCLYSDDFGTRTGKEVSMGGVYMSYLSLLVKDRCSSHAARTVAVTPSRVDSDCVLEAITEDLRVGAHEGWLCRCADGTVTRVWADVCFYVGDYLQVAKTSNLMGPGANSPCTLCTYRLHGAPGSRFGLAGSSMSTELMRTTTRTESVCAAASAWSELDEVV